MILCPQSAALHINGSDQSIINNQYEPINKLYRIKCFARTILRLLRFYNKRGIIRIMHQSDQYLTYAVCSMREYLTVGQKCAHAVPYVAMT